MIMKKTGGREALDPLVGWGGPVSKGKPPGLTSRTHTRGCLFWLDGIGVLFKKSVLLY